MRVVMSASKRPYGLRLSSSGVGSSVASASAAIVSMIRLTQSSCTAVSADSPPSTAETNATISAPMLIVS